MARFFEKKKSDFILWRDKRSFSVLFSEKVDLYLKPWESVIFLRGVIYTGTDYLQYIQHIY